MSTNYEHNVQAKNGSTISSAAMGDEAPARLWSLWDMLRFRGGQFHGLANILGMLSGIRSGSRTLIALGDQLGHKGHDVFPEGARDSIQKEIPKYRQILEEADLQLSLDSFERFVDHLAKPGVTTGQLGESAEELQNRIGDELSHMLLWQVTREDARFLDVA